MKYFFDTEFIEGFKKPINWLPTIGSFNKPYHSIQLISIGIVAEDGREYYAISNEFNPDDANKWVKDNVLYPIMRENGFPKNLSNLHGHLEYAPQPIRWIQKGIGRTNYQIACDIMSFTMDCDGEGLRSWDGWTDEWFRALQKEGSTLEVPEFYAYYADYDWVVFCSLFGTMMDLPKGFPMYCRDLKQMIDEKLEKKNWLDGRDCWANQNRSITNIGTGQHQSDDRPATLEEKVKLVKELVEYPKQANEHNALADAKWNFELFNFLKLL